MKPGKKKYLLILPAFICFCASSCINSSKETKDSPNILNVADLRSDFDIFRKTIEETHPGLYWYSNKKEMNSYFDSVYTSIDKPMNDVTFFKIMMNVVARVRCVHTSVSLSNERERAAASQLKMLPFDVLIANGKLYVSAKSSASRSLHGSEISAINGTPIQDVLEKILATLPSDGFNLTNKYQLLNRGMFRRSYALLYGSSDSFIIDVVDAANKSFRQKLGSVPPDFSASPLTPNNTIDWELRDNGRTAILNIHSFIIPPREFNRQIDSFFAIVKEKNLKKLIIDLRDNGGGNNENVTQLYSYVAEKAFYHLWKAELSNKKLSYPGYIINISEYNNLRGRMSPDSSNHEVNYRYPGTTLREPVPVNHYDGKLILLTSGATVSAASEFVALVHGNKRGIVVGEETGGCYYGSTGGNYLVLVLPNSRLRVRIPMIRIFTAVPEDFVSQPAGRGVIPDHPVVHSIEDLLLFKDRAMEKALSIN